MALTVEQLYEKYTGGKPDPSGLKFWTEGFLGQGDTIIDANEEASFARSVAEARAQGTEPATRAPTTPTITTQATQAPTAPVNPTVKLYQDTLGRTPSQAEIDSWNFGSTIDARELDSFLGAARNEAVNTMPTTGAVGKIANQILAQGTTSQWGGQGFGSPEKNAYDMAVMLAGQGITDINQFGKATKEIPVYGTDDYGNQIETGGTQTVTQFVNKATGQEIKPFYDKAGGNVWGGTFAGKDSTAYGVQFDAAGKPIFYSQYGGDSSDIGQLMPVIQLALAASGAGGALGGSLLGAGASQIATNALGNAILGAATTGLAGGDPLKGALLGGAGGALSGYLQGANGVTLGNASDIAFDMADAGSTLAEIEASLASRGFGADVITDALKDAANAMIPKAANVPIDGSSLVDTVNVVAPSGAPAISTNALTNILSQLPNIVDVSNIFKAGAPTPNIEVKDTRPIKSDIPVITTGTTPAGNTPTVTNPTISPPTTDLSTSDKLKVAQLGLAAAGLLGAGSALSSGTSGGVQYPIVDVPANWATPPRTSVAPATVLPPINFGDRNLLIGTQWEKFLDPNYGQVPEPIQYSQPSSLSYNDLMGILGSKQGMPLASTLSINDIISGIQNQYGQARSSTMG